MNFKNKEEPRTKISSVENNFTSYTSQNSHFKTWLLTQMTRSDWPDLVVYRREISCQISSIAPTTKYISLSQTFSWSLADQQQSQRTLGMSWRACDELQSLRGKCRNVSKAYNLRHPCNQVISLSLLENLFQQTNQTPKKGSCSKMRLRHLFNTTWKRRYVKLLSLNVNFFKLISSYIYFVEQTLL